MNNANELYVDATCVTSSISISNIAEQGAILKAQGPYDDFIFTLSVQDGAHGLVDMKTNEVYTNEKLFKKKYDRKNSGILIFDTNF